MEPGDLVQWKVTRIMDDNEAAGWSSDWANAADFNSPNVETKTGVIIEKCWPGRVEVLRDDGVILSRLVETVQKVVQE